MSYDAANILFYTIGFAGVILGLLTAVMTFLDRPPKRSRFDPPEPIRINGKPWRLP